MLLINVAKSNNLESFKWHFARQTNEQNKK